MKLLFLLLFVCMSTVLCANEKRQASYRFNHPPSAELEDEEEIVTENENIEKEVTTTQKSFPVKRPSLKLFSPKFSPTRAPKAIAVGRAKISVNAVKESKDDSKTQQVTKPRFKMLRRRLKQRVQVTEQPKTDNTIVTESVTEKLTPKTTTTTIRIDTSTRVRPTNVTPKPRRERGPIVPIIESENRVYSHSGNFHYNYEGGDGTIAYSEGTLKKIDNGTGEAVSGGFSYTDKDGNDFSLTYTADENGYRPVGAHLPTPPPIPKEIAQALEYLATATTPEPITKKPSRL